MIGGQWEVHVLADVHPSYPGCSTHHRPREGQPRGTTRGSNSTGWGRPSVLRRVWALNCWREQRRRLQGTMGGSSKHNGTKHSKKGPSIQLKPRGAASDSTMYFNEALARSWHGVGDFQKRAPSLSCAFMPL
jgi:hypothetical protein